MKKTSSRKLSLQRETITDLTSDALDDVAGGRKYPMQMSAVGTCFCPRNTMVCMPNISMPNLSMPGTFSRPNLSLKPGSPITGTVKPVITVRTTMLGK